MMKNFLILILFFIFYQNTFALEISKAKDAKETLFHLLLKRQTYHYIPYEYTALTDKNESLYPSRKSSELKENGKVLIPFVFTYENLAKALKVEVSYFEIEIVNANTLLFENSPSQISASRFYLSPMARSEFEGNAYKMFYLDPLWKVSLGGGIRNINRYLYGNYLSQGAFKEYFFTYGPQFSIESEVTLPYDLYWNLTLDIFYTQGTRFQRQPHLIENKLTYAFNNAGTEGVFRGYEFDTSLSYQFHSNMRLFLGFNQIISRFSYLNFNELRVTSNTNNLGSPNISLSDEFKWEKPIRKENFDRLQGIYFGLMVTF